MSLLEWLKFWSKFYRIPLFWNTVSEYPPSPENENCQRSWHFDFSVSEYPPPPPPENWNLGRSWHFKTFQSQNNWYQWQTMCGKLPHVETLSSPDNYSLCLFCIVSLTVTKFRPTDIVILCVLESWTGPETVSSEDTVVVCSYQSITQSPPWGNCNFAGGYSGWGQKWTKGRKLKKVRFWNFRGEGIFCVCVVGRRRGGVV